MIEMQPLVLGLRGNDTTVGERRVEQFEIWLLEERFGWTFGVGAVGNDDIELVLVVFEEGEAVGDVDGDVGVLESDGHATEEFLGESDDGLWRCQFWLCVEV